MTTATRGDAQQRADEIRVFRRECDRLEREGVLQLSAAQAAAVAEHHQGLLAGYAARFDIDQDVKASQLSFGMRVASLLGALALAASVLFLFYQFWGGFSTVAQVGLLGAAALGSLLVTFWVQGRDHSGYFTKLAALLAFVCFVLNVVMLGQIFNITPSDQALVPWAAFAFLLAYSCDLRLLLVAGIACVIAYLAARTGTAGGTYWLHFGERPENLFPAAVVLWVVPALIQRRRFDAFLPIYRVFALLTLLLPVLVLSNWGASSYLELDDGLIEGGYQLFGFAASACAIWLGVRRGWSEVINSGITFFVVFLYTKLYDWCWALMPKYLFFLLVGLVALLILFVLKRLRTAAAGLSGAGTR